MYISGMNREEAINYILTTFNKPYAHIRMKQSTFSSLVSRMRNNKVSVKKEIEFFDKFSIKININKIYEIENFKGR